MYSYLHIHCVSVAVVQMEAELKVVAGAYCCSIQMAGAAVD